MTNSASLDKRLRRVVRTHDRMRANGVVHRVGRDGLIRTRPRLIRPRFPYKLLLAIVVLFIAFKTLMFVQMGSTDYAVKVQDLRAGGVVEQIGAVLMQEDRVTTTLGGLFNTYIF